MNRVVVTGMGAISPIGNDVETLWDSLKTGKCGIDYVTKFDTSEHKAKVAAEVKDFDALKYMEKGVARKRDTYCKYGIAAATQAVEDSGIIGTVENERLAVYFGSGIGGMETFETEVLKLGAKGPKRVSPFFIPMMISNICAGEIAIKFGAKGACIPIVTACATSNNTIGEAYRAIKHGYADAVIAGGSEGAITQASMAGFSNMTALSFAEKSEDACCPFDKRRSGFVMGEGAGALILEEYERAIKRGAKIYAEIVGYGASCDAHHITAPDPEGTGGAQAMKLAMNEAGIDGSENIYVNAHGTSTPLNDKTETLVIKKALGEENARKAVVSSTKSMTGHMLGAAGAVEAIASIMALKEGIIPPTINYKEPDENCDLDYCPNESREWQAEYALSNGLGFGGHNACIAIKKFQA